MEDQRFSKQPSWKRNKKNYKRKGRKNRMGKPRTKYWFRLLQSHLSGNSLRYENGVFYFYSLDLFVFALFVEKSFEINCNS